MIPVSSPLAQTIRHSKRIQESVDRVLASGVYVLGPEVEALEREFAQFIGVSDCVAVGNATDALALSLLALDVGPGDEVITVSMTASATVSAIKMVGALPVLIDVEPTTLTMDPDILRSAISSKTRAVIPVHLYGHPAEMNSIRETCDAFGVPLLEDCSQAHGASIGGCRVGSLGKIGVFSCYPTKNLGALGDAALITTASADLAARLRRLRQYGWEHRNFSLEPGMNSRLDEVQAAILRVKLEHLDADNERRNAIAREYLGALWDLGAETPVIRQGFSHAFHLFVIRDRDRRRLQRRLARSNVGTSVHYPYAIHEQPGFVDCVQVKGPLGVTESATKSVFSLPMFPEISDDDVKTIVRALEMTLEKGSY